MNKFLRIKEKISGSDVAIGTHVKIGEPIVTDVLCSCGFDFIWVDGEHGPLDKRDIYLQIITIRGKGLSPFIRIPWNDPVLVKPVLEMGPAAVVFPFIKTVKEAKLAVSSCKYPPEGIRGFGPLRANNYSLLDNSEYLEISKKQPWVVLQIEHIDGINNLKEIIKVEGVDSVVSGPQDLSGSIGLLGQTRHPQVIKLLDKFADICREADFPFGVSTGWSETDVTDWIQRGVSWICVDNDVLYLARGGKNTFQNVKGIIDKLKQ